MAEGASGRRIKRDGGTGWQTETATDAAGFSDRATSTRTREEDNGRARRDERGARRGGKGGRQRGIFPLSRCGSTHTRHRRRRGAQSGNSGPLYNRYCGRGLNGGESRALSLSGQTAPPSRVVPASLDRTRRRATPRAIQPLRSESCSAPSTARYVTFYRTFPSHRTPTPAPDYASLSPDGV